MSVVILSSYTNTSRTRNAVGTRADKHVFHIFSNLVPREKPWERVYLFRVFPDFHECFYNSIERNANIFAISFREQRNEKEGSNLFSLIIKL